MNTFQLQGWISLGWSVQEGAELPLLRRLLLLQGVRRRLPWHRRRRHRRRRRVNDVAFCTVRNISWSLMMAPAVRRRRRRRRGCRCRGRRRRRRFELGGKDLFILCLVYFLSLQVESPFEGLSGLPSLASVGLLQRRGNVLNISSTHICTQLKNAFFVPISVSLRLTFPKRPHPLPSGMLPFRRSWSSILFILIRWKTQRHCKKKHFFKERFSLGRISHKLVRSLAETRRDDCHYNAIEWRVMETVMDHMPRPNSGVSFSYANVSSKLKWIAIWYNSDYQVGYEVEENGAKMILVAVVSFFAFTARGQGSMPEKK